MSKKGKNAETRHPKNSGTETMPGSRNSRTQMEALTMNTELMNDSKEQMEKAAQNLMQACEEMSVIARDQMDAAMRSANACWQGCSEINQNVGGLMQESMSRAVNAGKTIMGAKNVREMMDLQNEFMKDFFDCWVSGTGKISEISARVAKETVDPLAEQANNAVNKVIQRAKAA